MYNAGVVAIPKDKLAEVSQLALTLCDGMLAEDVERVTIEQYSLSIALYERTSLQEADKFIGHYWGNKPAWETIAYELMARAYMEKLTIEEELARIDIETLRQTPYYIHHSSTARRLKGLIDSCFKDKDLKYL